MQTLSDGPTPVPDMPFSRAEFAGRRERLVELLKRRSIDVALVSSPANFYWLTGLAANITSHVFALALRSDGQGVWIGRRMEMSNVAALAAWCWATDTIPIDDSEDAFSRLADALRRFGGAGTSIGVELSSAQMSAGGFTRLKAAVAGLQFVDSTGLMESLRSVKSPAELAYLREAGAITGAAITAAIQNLGEGTRDSDLAARLVSEAIRRGSEPMAEGPYVTCGARSFRAHSSWNHVPIARGEIINTELAAARAHYHTPLFRVSVLGEGSDALRRFHDASLAGLQAGLDGIGPGMTSADADAIVRERIDRAGYGEYFAVRAAYGIGVGFPPGWGENSVVNIRPGDGRLLEPGMCFHLVPALYKAGLGAVCCSMPIHITGNGVERLTDIEPRLFVLDS
jgi:Xaa-Pro dipeptidase